MDIARKEELTHPQTGDTNGALSLVNVRDWKDEMINVIKKALRMEIGQLKGRPAMEIGQLTGSPAVTGSPDGHNGKDENAEHFPDVYAVRHINVFGSQTSLLMEISCTPEKEETLRTFFEQQGIEVCDGQINPCIDPAILETVETDKRKIALRLKNHFVRILLAWWKAANYVYSPDIRLFYKRTLRHLISGDGKLFQWIYFIHAVHIDAEAVKKERPPQNMV